MACVAFSKQQVHCSSLDTWGVGSRPGISAGTNLRTTAATPRENLRGLDPNMKLSGHAGQHGDAGATPKTTRMEEPFAALPLPAPV